LILEPEDLRFRVSGCATNFPDPDTSDRGGISV
jgi:hypothetical protein